jgi:hypothetical protein
VLCLLVVLCFLVLLEVLVALGHQEVIVVAGDSFHIGECVWLRGHGARWITEYVTKDDGAIIGYRLRGYLRSFTLEELAPLRVTIARSRLSRSRLASGPGPEWKWTYECDGPRFTDRIYGPQSGHFTNDSLVDLREVLRRRYGRSVDIVESWKSPQRSTSSASVTSITRNAVSTSSPSVMPVDLSEPRVTPPRYVYVASSWRNTRHGEVVAALRWHGIEVYDFMTAETAFSWRDAGLEVGNTASGESVAFTEYLAAIEHPRSVAGFASDFAAMERADACVLVLPCGRSAHLELGWAVGQGKRTAILFDDVGPVVPELMYRMVDYLAPSLGDLLNWLGVPADATGVVDEGVGE